ncbi:MAG: hypothetical protein MHM6MM_007228 [Cercozoa sp. M6MM]
MCVRQALRLARPQRSFFSTAPVELRETRHLPNVNATRMFNAVAGVDRYHEFLPFCRSSDIIDFHTEDEDENAFFACPAEALVDVEFDAELKVGFLLFNESYTSRVSVNPTEGIVCAIASDTALFDTLENRWHVKSDDNGGCHIDFLVKFAFRDANQQATASQLLTDMTSNMADAFVERARRPL